MTDLSAVLDLALLYNQALAYKDMGTINMWINEGADVDRDIVPAMKKCIDQHGKRSPGQKIGSFSYFTNEVRRNRDARLLLERHVVPKDAATDPEAIHRLAKMWAKTVRTFGIKDAVCISKLAAYEAQYGRVEA
jgi:hypothetical protein